MVEMAVSVVSGSTEFQIILEGHGAEWSRQKWYGWNPHILGSSKHHPELPADVSGHDNPKQFDLTALLSRDFGMLSSDDSRNLYISVTGSEYNLSIFIFLVSSLSCSCLQILV